MKVYSRSEKDFLGGGIVVMGFVFEKVWKKKMKHSSKKKIVYLVCLISFSAIFFSQVWAHLNTAWDFSCVLFFPYSFKDHFAWNKVTSCIHNILSGQRWIEHYGEIIIKNLNDDTCHCKLTFIKVTTAMLALPFLTGTAVGGCSLLKLSTSTYKQ